MTRTTPATAARALALLCAAGLLMGSPATDAREPRAKKVTPRIEVQGHRGARALRPENTLAAFRYALALGVDTLELDLQVTADDVLVVAHDAHIPATRCLGRGGKRLSGKPPAIRQLRARALAGYDCGSLVSPRFPRQKLVPKARIPRFEEVLTLVRRTHARGQKVGLNVETKIVPGRPKLTPTPERFAALVIQALRRHKLQRHTTLQSFDYRTLVAARRLAPKLRIVLLTSESTTDYPALARRYRPYAISPHHAWITRRDIVTLHRLGVRVIPWTANTKSVWRRLVGLGVDGIISDDPAGLITYLRGRRSQATSTDPRRSLR